MTTAKKGARFERRVAHLLKQAGHHEVEVTQQTGDGGIDILMYDRDTKDDDRIRCGVECKDIESVGRPIIQKFHSAMDMLKTNCKYKRGYVVTTGHFTRAAEAYARDVNIKHHNYLEIRLIDGKALQRLEQKYSEQETQKKKYTNTFDADYGGVILFFFVFYIIVYSIYKICITLREAYYYAVDFLTSDVNEICGFVSTHMLILLFTLLVTPIAGWFLAKKIIGKKE